MSDFNKTLSIGFLNYNDIKQSNPEVPAMLVLWSREQPQTVGSVFLIPTYDKQKRKWLLGRDAENIFDDEEVYLKSFYQRPGTTVPSLAIVSNRISRKQLLIEKNIDCGTISISNIGRCPVLFNGEEKTTAEFQDGMIIELKEQLTLLCTHRMLTAPPSDILDDFIKTPFGVEDQFGFVGESILMWELRKQLAFVSKRNVHVLLLGESGTGKELVAKAVHSLSKNKKANFVSRNAATIPETLIDAELFGNAKNYPNAGMPDRIGLIGESNGGTLFLDEIGELPMSLQAHLLRVLDEGEYQRLGESQSRRAVLRLLGATNRDPAIALKHDILARFQNRIILPNLNQRREDIPLLVQYLLKRIANKNEGLLDRHLRDFTGSSYFLVHPSFIFDLVTHQYTTHVRELDSILWHSISLSKGIYLESCKPWPVMSQVIYDDKDTKNMYSNTSAHSVESNNKYITKKIDIDVSKVNYNDTANYEGNSNVVASKNISKQDIEQAILKHDGVLEKVWKELRLSNRFVLYRLMKKYSIQNKN